MIIQWIIENLISPVIATIIKLFPTIALPYQIGPYIVSAVGFFAELFSYISYFVPLDFFFLVILAKTAFYGVRFVISAIKFVGEVL